MIASLILGVASCVILYGIALTKLGDIEGAWYILGGLASFGVFSIPGGLISDSIRARRYKLQQHTRDKYYTYRKEVDAIREELGVANLFK